MTAELASDLIDWLGAFDSIDLRFLFPLVPTCEFRSKPMHGCECNNCLLARCGEAHAWQLAGWNVKAAS